MNPDEDSARHIAENLGTREGLLDGERKPLVEPHQLTGSEFANDIVVFSRGAPPARLEKFPAFADPVCRARISGQEPVSPWTAAAPPPIPDVEPASPAGSAHLADAWDVLKPPTPGYAPESESAQTGSPADHGNFNWDVLKALPAGDAPECASPIAANVFSAVDRRVLIAGAVACLAFVAAAAWIMVQANEVSELRKEKDRLATFQNAATQAAAERASLAQALKSAEQDHDRMRADASAARSQLQKEADAHAATKIQLATIQRQLDAARAAAPPPQTTIPSQSAAPAPAPMQGYPADRNANAAAAPVLMCFRPNLPRALQTAIRSPPILTMRKSCLTLLV